MDKFIERKCDDDCEYRRNYEALYNQLLAYSRTGQAPQEISIQAEEIQRLLKENRELRKELTEYKATGLTPQEIASDIRIHKELWEEKIKELQTKSECEKNTKSLYSFPFCIGDYLYYIRFSDIQTIKVTGFKINNHGSKFEYVFINDDGKENYWNAGNFSFSRLGKDIFLTQEDAEKYKGRINF